MNKVIIDQLRWSKLDIAQQFLVLWYVASLLSKYWNKKCDQCKGYENEC